MANDGSWQVGQGLIYHPLVCQGVPRVTDFMFTTFYPLLMWLMMLFAVITGYGRTFEGKDGKVVTSKMFDNSIPAEVDA